MNALHIIVLSHLIWHNFFYLHITFPLTKNKSIQQLLELSELVLILKMPF